MTELRFMQLELLSQMKYILIIICSIGTLALHSQCVDNGNYWNESWVSCTTSTNPNSTRGNSHWILYDFHEPQYILTSHIWNANRTGESGMGAKNVIIDYSTDGTNWLELGEYTFPQAPESSNYTGDVGPDFGGVFLKKILITILSTYDEGNCVSIAELQFDIDPTACYGTIDVCGVCNGSGETTWYLDADGDGLGDINHPTNACTQPASYVDNHEDDCDNGNLGWTTIGTLLADNGCTNCHGAGASGGLDLRTYVTTAAGGDACGSDILTGTKLVDIINISGYNECAMPIAGSSMNNRVGGQFDTEELALLQLWVDGGAPESCDDFCLNNPVEIPYNGLDDDCDPLTLDDDLDGDGFINALDCDDQNSEINQISGDIYVDSDALGSNDGSSWENAFTDLQSALAVGTNRFIHIAEGTYFPTTNSSRAIFFNIPSNTQLLGGYPSGGGTRNPKNHPTTLSGEVDGITGNDFNSFHVVSMVNVDCITLDGLVISGGGANNPNSFARARGAGLYINNANKILITNCTIENNTALFGGGMFAYTSTVDIVDSDFTVNTADYGSAMYHSNQTELLINRTKIIDNISLVRCAIEVNNSLYTRIENSLIANNFSANANAIGLIATNRDQSIEVMNSTILGEENKNRTLITLQVGFGDQLDATFYNSIIAHQNHSFTKTLKDYNNNILNVTTENCYIQGSSVLGNATNNLYSTTAGTLMLNADYSLNACSPAVNAGNDALAVGTIDIAGNNRIFDTVDIGAFETEASCESPSAKITTKRETKLYPNPTSGMLTIASNEEILKIEVFDILGKLILKTMERELDMSQYPSGVYIFHLKNEHGLIRTEKVVKE